MGISPNESGTYQHGPANSGAHGHILQSPPQLRTPMAKRTAKAKGKRPATTLRVEDGRFLPNIPDPPGSPSHLGPGPSGPPPQTEPEVSGTPMHPGGLGYHDSSSDKIYATNLRPEADLELVVDRERTPPSRYSPPGRSLSVSIPVTLSRNHPVTVETVTDEVAARRRSHAEVTSPEIGGSIHVEKVTSSSNIFALRAEPSFCGNLPPKCVARARRTLNKTC